MMSKTLFIVLVVFLVYAGAFYGSQFAETSEMKPVPPAQQVPPLKDDIDTLMQQRAVQRSAPGHSEDEQDEGEDGAEVTDDATQETGNQD